MMGRFASRRKSIVFYVVGRSPDYVVGWSPAYVVGRSPAYVVSRSPDLYVVGRSPDRPTFAASLIGESCFASVARSGDRATTWDFGYSRRLLCVSVSP